MSVGLCQSAAKGKGKKEKNNNKNQKTNKNKNKKNRFMKVTKIGFLGVRNFVVFLVFGFLFFCFLSLLFF